jgi:Zn-dependent alcohol dehydrogenase
MGPSVSWSPIRWRPNGHWPHDWAPMPCSTPRPTTLRRKPEPRQAIGMASKGGTVVIVGVPADDVAVPLPVVQDHQICIQGSATYLPEDYAESIRLLVEGDVRVDDIVTAEVPLTRVADAYALSSGGEHVKVLVAVDEQLFASTS